MQKGELKHYLELHCRKCLDLQHQFPNLKSSLNSLTGTVDYFNPSQEFKSASSLGYCQYHGICHIRVDRIPFYHTPFSLTKEELEYVESQEKMKCKTKQDSYHLHYMKKQVSRLFDTRPKYTTTIPDSQSSIDDFIQKSKKEA